jgi:glycosyltransferase involved in cell wall biosynthesis
LGAATSAPPNDETIVVAVVGTYPPTACGVATFTGNVAAAIASPGSDWSVRIIRVLDRPETEVNSEVTAQWIANDDQSLRRSLDVINSCDAVVVQHEYGLFAGRDGDAVLELMRGVRVPLVAVLHTVLTNPTPHQRVVLDELIAGTSLTVVQSKAARSRLMALHDVAAERVVVIPHGAVENVTGPVLDDIPRPAILTWGLFGPGKGIEHAIAAVSLLANRSPAPTYIVAGRTHPKVAAAEGEHYRNRLVDLCAAYGVSDMVRFDDSYRDWDSLRALVRSVDVVLLPYDSTQQVSSGVLVEALAAGRPVVSTRFPHAEELLAGGAGLSVAQGDFRAMAGAMDRVLYEPGLATRMSRSALREAAALHWPAVGAAYRSLITEVMASSEVGV